MKYHYLIAEFLYDALTIENNFLRAKKMEPGNFGMQKDNYGEKEFMPTTKKTEFGVLILNQEKNFKKEITLII